MGGSETRRSGAGAGGFNVQAWRSHSQNEAALPSAHGWACLLTGGTGSQKKEMGERKRQIDIKESGSVQEKAEPLDAIQQAPLSSPQLLQKDSWLEG